ncbi:MAG: hypothetical protein GXZ04_05635 [Clostridiales bacterium]|nr:hypothetical protein [Clostridiales bacterium]
MKPEQPLKTAMDRRLSGLKVTGCHLEDVIQKARKKPRMKRSHALVLSFAIIALLGTAIAASLPATIAWYQSFYGQEKGETLKQGTLMPIHMTKTLGEVQYEWLETIHVGDTGRDEFMTDSNMLYGTVNITPVKGANLVLILEDYRITDPAGYQTHLGEKAPAGAPSYLDLAIERDAKIVLAQAVPHGILVDGKLQEGWEIGYSYASNQDGSVNYYFEIPMVKAMPEYTILMRINNWEITRQGTWLREGPTDTWLKEDWIVTIKPPKK